MMGKLRMPEGHKPEYTAWLWRDGTVSQLHKKHPRYEGMTWCGAWWSPTSSANNGAKVYEGKEAKRKATELCPDCHGRTAGPLFIGAKEPEYIRALVNDLRDARRVANQAKHKLSRALGMEYREDESHSKARENGHEG